MCSAHSNPCRRYGRVVWLLQCELDSSHIIHISSFLHILYKVFSLSILHCVLFTLLRMRSKSDMSVVWWMSWMLIASTISSLFIAKILIHFIPRRSHTQSQLHPTTATQTQKFDEFNATRNAMQRSFLHSNWYYFDEVH